MGENELQKYGCIFTFAFVVASSWNLKNKIRFS